MDLVEISYKISLSFPHQEKYGLTSQIQRSAVSVPSNITEGAGRNSKKVFRNFLGIANGSLNELITQLELAKRLGYINKQDLQNALSLGDEIQKMIYTLINKFSQV